ncbi:hypothetical protein AVEN_83945-1 [Araneus ventricosus]|uniref:Uncharacterized protein n=1 Tax=Araneus ventricosus TaxID=182803 RepID=A0A4Y2BRD7_ARAVE|nr:hypothetical protein AVEN_83945-1 [Araneus ventricosus]
MYHPSNGLPRTANTWGYVAVHEKQEANRVATASHGELPRLPSREGRKRQKLKERKNQKGDQTLGYLGVVKPVTSREDVPLRVGRTVGEEIIRNLMRRNSVHFLGLKEDNDNKMGSRGQPSASVLATEYS